MYAKEKMPQGVDDFQDTNSVMCVHDPKIEMALKKADLLDKQSPKDILLELSKVYLIQLNDCNIISEVPKKLERMEEKMGSSLF